MEYTIELRAKCHTTDAILPYDAMDVRAWQRRVRVVSAAPPSIVASYVPLASATFTKLCTSTYSYDSDSMIIIGDVGLNFALDERKQPVMSVEAAALYQLMSSPGEPEAIPDWLTQLQASWTSGQCLFMFNPETGWRGCSAEHKLRSAVLLADAKPIKTPYCKPHVRAWFPPAILDDMKMCVGAELVSQVASTIASLGFDGAPDLVLYRKSTLWFVEVKSTTDSLREAQVRDTESNGQCSIRSQLVESSCSHGMEPTQDMQHGHAMLYRR